MALLHAEKHEWVLTEVYDDGMVTIRRPHSGFSGVHLLYEATEYKLFPNLTALRAYARIMGLDIG